jgi:GNAT superfamily N-acetyltransferase
MISRGRLFRPAENPGFMAEEAGEPVGVITFEFLGGECEVTRIDSPRPGQDIGGDLLRRVAAEARATGCRRLWLVTTNDNLDALRFYQRRGLRLTAIYPGAVDDTRRRKPEIPPVGEYGIPLRDEIELEMALE